MKAWQVFFEIGGELEVEGAAMFFEVGGDLEEGFECGVGVFEAFEVSDGLGGFEDELKSGGDLAGPRFDGGGSRETVEAAVDFDGWEVGGVEGEHLGLGEIFWVEGGFPFFVAVPAGADEEVHGELSIYRIAKFQSDFP